MTGGRRTLQSLLGLAVVAGGLCCPKSGLAQKKQTEEPVEDQPVPLSEPASPQPAEDSTEISDEGVPEEAVEASDGVSEVERAMEQVAEDIEEGLPAEFTIQFGDTHDWIRLTSGEWLKGNLKRMREDEIEFDSDKLNIVKFDWGDVDQVHSPQINTYVFGDKVDLFGRAVVTKDQVLLETADGVQIYPRSDLLSIVQGTGRERDWWSMRVGAGFSANAGNTDQGSLNAYFQLMRADYRTRARAAYEATVGYADGQENVNRHIGTIEVRLFLSRRWYFTPAATQLLNDRFQNIHFRATPGAGAGVHVFDTNRVEWDIDAGLGYQYLNVLSTVAGAKDPQSDGFATVGTWADFEFYKDVKLEVEWRTNFVYTTIGNTNHTGRVKFSVEVTDIFDFETSFLFLRTEDPPPRSDGTVPAKNDYQLIVSVALEID